MALFPTKKISALAPATTPLTGFEEFECVQTGNSRKVISRDFVLPTDSILTVSGMGGSLPGSRQLTPGIGIAFVDGGPGSTLSINATGAVAGPADPTAFVGLTPVNGVALTYLRSDSAPALDQGIAPTWTGNHIFAANQNQVRNALPQWIFVETDAAADNQVWPIRISGEQFNIGALNDIGSVFTPWVTVDRTGTTIDLVNLQGTTVSVNGQNIRNAAILTSGLVGTARLGGGVADATTWLRGDQTWQSLPGSFTGFANPTASLGLAAINGVATTAMRSDAAPALSQTIAPTWTAQHNFSRARTAANEYAVLLTSTAPAIGWFESDASLDNKRWHIFANGEQLGFSAGNDADTTGTAWLAVDRTGITIDSIALTSTALTWNGNPLLSTATAFANPSASIGLAAVNGAATTAMRSDAAPALSQAIAPTWSARHTFSLIGDGSTGTAIDIASTLPQWNFRETDAAVDNRVWSFSVNGEQLRCRVSNDAGAVVAPWLTVDRTGAVVDTVAFPTATAGSFLVGTSVAIAGSRLAHFSAPASVVTVAMKNVTATFQTLDLWNADTAGDNLFAVFSTEAAITTRGSISYNRGAGLTAYNTTSDARRKKNIRNAPEAASVIDSIRVRSFEWIDSDIHLDHWIVAQELHAVCPYAVTEGNDTRDWAVDTSKLVPLMIKELQSIRQRLMTLETPGNSNRN